jgi:hypothetical protein
MWKKTKSRSRAAAACVLTETMERRLLMSTYTVNTLSDAVTPVMGQLTLRQAIADANASPGSDTIAFSPTVFTTSSQHVITLTQGELNVTGDTTVQGPGQNVLLINGNQASRVMQISSGATVSVSGLTLINGSVTSAVGELASGGAVLNDGSLNLTSVTVSDSTANGGSPVSDQSYGITAGAASGGGIYSIGTLSLTNSTVSDNTANGGASFYGFDGNSSGGGVYSAGQLTISNSTIQDNIAGSGGADVTQNGAGGESNGGGLYVTGPLIINSSTLSGNSAAGGDGTGFNSSFNPGGAGDGGAIYATASSTLSGDTFTGNTATGGNSGGGGGYGSPASGGAIFSRGSTVINLTTLQDNSATGGNGAFDDSGAGGNASGGAIEAMGSLNISSSSIVSNHATGGYGAPHSGEPNSSAQGGGIDSTISLALLNSTVSGNSATAGQGGMGGGPYGGAGGAGEGGGAYLSGTARITDSTFSGNNARGGLGESPYGGGGSPGGNGGDADGGAIYNNAALTVTNSTLADNSATGGAGGFAYEGTGGNGANGGGSAVYSVDTLDLYDSTVTGNTTTGGAAGGNSYSTYPAGSAGSGTAAIRIAVTQGNDAMDNTIVSGNVANGSTEDDILGDFISSNSSYNLVGTDSGLTNGVNGNIVAVDNPMLSPLASNGGATQTLLPLYNSPAVNAGSKGLIPAGVTTDQRGYARIAGGTVDIGAVELQHASISGTVFSDTNGDGIRESGEAGLAGVTVYADLANAGAYQAGDPVATTDANGNYSLNGVPEGMVIIRQILPSGYRQSYPLSGAGEHLTLTPTGIIGALFADSTRLYISGTVTYNGVGESGVVVYADLNNDGTFESNENNKTTLSDGSFAFVSLTPGTYTFRVVAPAGQMVSGNSAIMVTLGSGGIDQNVSFSLATASTGTKLTGTVIGTAGSYQNDGNTIAKAFDGILTNYFDGPTANSDYLGLNFGSPQVITSIAYDPRTGFASRMVGGIFQGSNNADFSGAVNLYTITTAPTNDTLTTVSISNTTAFQYVRYLAPNGSYGDVGELAFYGYAPSFATVNSSGDLIVSGTNGNDTISIAAQLSQTDTGYTDSYTVVENGATETINTPDVNTVMVNTLDGNDTVSINGSAEYDGGTVPTAFVLTVNLGTGNDLVNTSIFDDGFSNQQYTHGGGTTTTVVGGDGSYTISLVGGANDVVTLGDGNDNVTTSATFEDVNATLIAGDGNDTLSSGGSGPAAFVDDTMTAGSGEDYFYNTDENDSITGTGGGQSFTIGFQATGAATITGVAFVDTNHDGQYEAGEPVVPYAKINTSAGLVTADANGRYTVTFSFSTQSGSQVGPYTLSLHSPSFLSGFNIPVTPASQQMTGTVIGTGGSYSNLGNTAAKAFDGNLSTFFDAPTASGSWAGMDLGSVKVITSISYAPRSGWASRMVGGVFQASNSATFSSGVVNLFTVTSTPATGVLTTVTISNTSAYRYVRYIGPANSYCNIAEAEFFGTTPQQATGTIVGTSGSYNNQGNTIANVIDGNLSTYFDAPTASGSWVGLDLGSAQVVTEVEYAPRSGWASRMVGGEIQASNSADFSSGVVTLLTITSTPATGVLTTQLLSNTTAYRYYRYIGPANGYCNIAELQFEI